MMLHNTGTVISSKKLVSKQFVMKMTEASEEKNK